MICPTWSLRFGTFPPGKRWERPTLDAGMIKEAEATYRDDLKKYANNGWSLFGLLQCLRQSGRTKEAAEVERRFREAWQRADVTLTASWF